MRTHTPEIFYARDRIITYIHVNEVNRGKTQSIPTPSMSTNLVGMSPLLLAFVAQHNGWEGSSFHFVSTSWPEPKIDDSWDGRHEFLRLLTTPNEYKTPSYSHIYENGQLPT